MLAGVKGGKAFFIHELNALHPPRVLTKNHAGPSKPMPFIGISFNSLEAMVSGESWGAEPSLIQPMPRAIRGILNLTEASSLDAHIHTLHSVIASLEQHH